MRRNPPEEPSIPASPSPVPYRGGSRSRVSDGLRKGDELAFRQLQGMAQLRLIEGPAKDRGQALGGAEEVDVAVDEAASTEAYSHRSSPETSVIHSLWATT